MTGRAHKERRLVSKRRIRADNGTCEKAGKNQGEVKERKKKTLHKCDERGHESMTMDEGSTGAGE